MRCQGLMAGSVQSEVLWDVTLCSLVRFTCTQKRKVLVAAGSSKCWLRSIRVHNVTSQKTESSEVVFLVAVPRRGTYVGIVFCLKCMSQPFLGPFKEIFSSYKTHIIDYKFRCLFWDSIQLFYH